MSVNKIALDNQRTIDQLRIENELKTKWLSLIAHDFKGLFSNIQLLIDAFESESITQELFMSLLPELKQIAEKNSKTLENTFEWVKSQTEGFNPQLQDIRGHDLFKEIHNEVIDTVGLKELSVQFTGNQSQSLCTDRVLLKFILKHIIDNAIKYSNKKGLIEVMAYSDSNLNEISITIKDYGMGMKESIVNDMGTLNNSIIQVYP